MGRFGRSGIEVVAKRGERGGGVVAVPDQRVRVDRRGVVDGDAAHVVVGGAEVSGVLACEIRERRGLVEYVEQVLGAEVWADALDREPEGVGEVVVVDVPFASGEHPWHPDSL